MSLFKPSERQSAILEMIRRRGFVSTDAMVSEFAVTPQTIRRDLNELSGEGLLTRFHGGAGQSKSGENPPYKDRQQTGVVAKRKIATRVSSLIPDEASIFLGTGTTIEAVAESLLEHKKLHIITNNINVARIMSPKEDFQIIIAGGLVRVIDGGIFGPSSHDFIGNFRMDFGIVGISGVHEDGSLLEFSQEEVKTARTVVRGSQKVIMVADKHKFGRRAMHRVGHLRDVDVLVTDSELLPHFVDLCDQEAVDVFVG